MAEQPTGTVTLLFTDIEGSTALLRQLGTERYGHALDLHRTILRAAFQRHDGYEVDSEGDAFFVAFSRAVDAVAAAREGQAELAATEWPESQTIKVRMGIHTGEPAALPPKYVGLDVHKAARIMAAGHGGQVLLSRTARDLIGDEVHLRDLGEHRLKDLSGPERLWQLGESDFPPLKSLHQTNLPVQPFPLVGRERELAELAALFRDGARLVTLTGVGGAGKTRLAMQAAGEMADQFPDGVWFVPLASVADAGLVEGTVAQVLQVQDRLVDALRSKRLLIVLDNFEHLLDAGPAFAEVVAAAPDVRLLVTSRERLALSAEREYEVPPLRVADAVELFVMYARRADHSFEPDDAVTRIAQRLDGLPLALELAAARVKVLTTAQINARLGTSLDLLAGGARDVPERQRTLRATIGWSYDLLSPPERASFCRFGVFAGSFELDAAEAIAGAGLDVISSLVDKSLVRRTSDGRFFVLETIRQFAAEELAAEGGRDATRAEHARYYVGLARLSAIAPWAPFSEDWSSRFLLEEAQLRAALTTLRERGDQQALQEAAEALWYTWFRFGRLAEGRAWLEQALEPPPDDHHRHGVLLSGLSGIVWRQGDAEVALETAEAATAVFRRLDEPGWLVHTLRDISNAYVDLGDLDAGERALVESEECAVRVEDYVAVAMSRGNRAEIMLARSDFEGALRVARDAVELAEAHAGRDSAHAASIHHTCGLAQFCLGRIDEAAQSFRTALAAIGSRPDAEQVLFAVEGLAACAARIGELARAARLLGALGRLSADTGMRLYALPQSLHDEAVRVTRAALGIERFEECLAAGVELAVDELVREALRPI
jgi:predicted ATPase/class 3 adenylate cyclase